MESISKYNVVRCILRIYTLFNCVLFVLQIQYDKQCGTDNFCDTDLELKVVPLTDSGYLVYGKDRNLDVQGSLYNARENAYNIIIDVEVAGNISSALRTISLQGRLLQLAS